MGYYVVDEDKINGYEDKLEEFSAELEDYEHDFAILKDQQAVALKMYSIADNNIDVTSIMASTIVKMETVADENKITGLEEIFDLEPLKLNGECIKPLLDENADFMDLLDRSGRKMDTLKEDVAEKILKYSSLVETYEQLIQYEKDNPSKYVEDDD